MRLAMDTAGGGGVLDDTMRGPWSIFTDPDKPPVLPGTDSASASKLALVLGSVLYTAVLTDTGSAPLYSITGDTGGLTIDVNTGQLKVSNLVLLLLGPKAIAIKAQNPAGQSITNLALTIL